MRHLLSFILIPLLFELKLTPLAGNGERSKYDFFPVISNCLVSPSESEGSLLSYLVFSQFLTLREQAAQEL